MAVTYFGKQDGVDIYNFLGSGEVKWRTASYTCPGAGAQNIKELAAHIFGAGGNILVGVYDTSNNLIVEGNAQKVAAAGWVTWSDAELTWSVGTTLTGGVEYVLVVSSDANPGAYGLTGQGNGTGKRVNADWTAGMNDPLPAGDNDTEHPNVRCGVEPAAVSDKIGAKSIRLHEHIHIFGR